MIDVSYNDFYKEVTDVFNNPRPWAHIRFGDGEGIVMRYPEKTSENHCRSRWTKWLGENNIDMKEFALEVRYAVEIADIVGIPCARHDQVNADWRDGKKFTVNLIGKDQKSCCMDWTVQMQKDGHYRTLLKNKELIYYISCRDVSAQIESCGVKNAIGYLLPPQHRPKMGNVCIARKHYPDLFNEIPFWLDGIEVENQIFLIGAGGLGKLYCTWVKERRGIALDVGSLFDGWSGLVSRSYLKNIKEYKL